MSESVMPSIRWPLLTGLQPVAGLWFCAALHDEPTRQRLILQQWRSGASAHRFAEGDLLRFARNLSVTCESQCGWPLIRQGRALSSAPFTPAELHNLPTADLWLVRAGQVIALHLRDAELLVPGEWLDLSALTLLDTCDFQVQWRSAVPDSSLDPLPVSRNVRTILGGQLAPPAPQQHEVVMALHRASAAQTPSSGSAARSGPGGSRMAEEPGQFMRRMAAAALSWLLRETAGAGAEGKPGNARDGGARGGGVPAAMVGRAEAAALAKSWLARWRERATRMLLQTRLAEIYGRRQAEYLRRMLEMFDRGDLNEALRHAIPLGDESSGGEHALGTPERRDTLELSAARVPSRSLLLGGSLQDELKQVYRQSFQRLDREGRIDEAAFVLAELLNVRREAIDYLEKHGRHRQAADLALAWDMPAAMIVRLLCLADDWARAVLVARRDQAFADAVLLLHKTRPQLADRLRLEWAQSLTDKGLWLQAVDVIWPLAPERERATQWLLNAEAAGGSLAAGALVKRAILLPDTLATYADRIEDLRGNPARCAERTALAQALLTHRSHGADALAWLAGAIVRAVLADHVGGQAQAHSRLDQDQLHALIGMSRDTLLKADLPPGKLSLKARRSLDVAEESLQWTAPDMGSRAILDAALLSDDRYLLALGEAGAVVVDATGKTLIHLQVPAQKIVLAHSRQVALVLARRSAVWRISKLDLVNRQSTDLGVLMLDVFARAFDGTAWTIGHDCQLRVVDVDRGFSTLWNVKSLPGQLVGMLDDERNECLLLMDPDAGLQLWHYRLPERRLTCREPIQECSDDVGELLIGCSGIRAGFRVQADAGAAPVLVLRQGQRTCGYRLHGLDHDLTERHPVNLSLFEPWLIVRYVIASGDVRWLFIHRSSDRTCAVLDWPASKAQIRSQGRDWLIFDDEGRLSHINVDTASQRNLSLH